jgi:hypothetical protein
MMDASVMPGSLARQRDRYLQLADPLAQSADPAEQKRLKEQLAPVAFGD